MARRNCFLLDTNILVHLIRGREIGRAIAAYFNLYGDDVELLVSVVSIGEVFALGRQWGWDNRRLGMVRYIIDQTVVVDINSAPVLRVYSEMDCHSKQNGCKMGKNDVWIAATARVNSALLLTTDQDFEHLFPSHLERVLIDPATGHPKATS